jgi:hypothetical protein
LEEKIAENTALGIRHADHMAPPSAKVGTNFADKLQSLGRYSSLPDSGHRVQLYIVQTASGVHPTSYPMGTGLIP